MNLFPKIFYTTTGITVFVVIFWSSLSVPKQDWLMHKLGLYEPTPLVTQYDRVAAPAADTAPVVAAVEPGGSASALRGITQGFEQHERVDCRVESRAVTDVDKVQIYTWVDAQGQVHYGERKPTALPSRELTDRYAAKAQYFTMDLGSPDGRLPPLLNENLRRDVTAIYGYLAERLEPQYLRQSLLNLRVFDTKDAFNAHRKSVYPGASFAVSGFYSPRRNEAVVMRQKRDARTRAVARHEATHVINAALFGPTPAWFNEGLAEYFESRTHSHLKGLDTPTGNNHQRRLRRLMQTGQLPALREHLALSNKQWRSHDPQTMYAIAWSIVHYLLDHTDGDGLMRIFMRHMAQAPCSEVDFLSLWEQHYPGGLQAFERRWLGKLQAAARG